MASVFAVKPNRSSPFPQPTQFTPRWGAPKTEGAAVTDSPVLEPTPGLASDRLRERMIQRLRDQGIQNSLVLKAMASVPRHQFVDAALASRAYEDSALPIGHSQTISQPYVVARAIELALTHLPFEQAPGRALEVGGGCGYQAAVLAKVFAEVYSVERILGLHQQARRNLFPMALANLHLMHGDGLTASGRSGLFQAIFLAAGMSDIPLDLLRELQPGGVLVAPLGSPRQKLVVVRVTSGETQADRPTYERREFDEVSYVPILRGLQK